MKLALMCLVLVACGSDATERPVTIQTWPASPLAGLCCELLAEAGSSGEEVEACGSVSPDSCK